MVSFTDPTPILTVKHGSLLYGTATPQSDLDYKGVHVPSGHSIVLQRPQDVIDKGIKVSTSIKNQVGDVDHQSYSVQKYLKMLSTGDTVATEMLFASRSPDFMDEDETFNLIWDNRYQILNRDCKGFVGYCVRQAAKYGIKGSRMKAVKDILDFLDIQKLGLPNTTQLDYLKPILEAWSKGREHVSWENIPSPHGTDIWHLNVCDRKMPMTASIKDAYAVWDRVWQNYGERARQAMTNEGIDWKAMSHAVRVARQAIELLSTGEIVFPRPDAAELLQIKLGLLPYSEVSQLLEDLVEQVRTTKTDLPEKSNTEAIDMITTGIYMEAIRA